MTTIVVVENSGDKRCARFSIRLKLTIVTCASDSRPRGLCLYMVRGAFEAISIQREPFKHLNPPWYRMRNVKMNIHGENLKLSGIHGCGK